MTADRISEEVMERAWRAFCNTEQEYADYATALADALRAVVPLIESAALRRSAIELRDEAIQRIRNGEKTPLEVEAVPWLRARADRLVQPRSADDEPDSP